MKKNISKGIYLALLTATISGFSIFFNKFAVDIIKPPLVFTTFKNIGVGLFIMSILLVSGKWKMMIRLKRKEIIYLALIGIIGGSLPFYLFFTGLSQVPAINAAILQKTLVVWVILLAVPFLKEKLSLLQIVAIAILFSSNFIMGGFTKFEYSQGEIFILLSAVLWAVEYMFAKKVLSTIDPDIVTAARMGVGSLILLVGALITAPAAVFGIVALNSTQWFWMVSSTLILLAYLMSWYRALKYAPAIMVTAILVSSTLITNILSSIFITHKWTLSLHIQNIMLFVGVVMLWVTARKMKPQEVLEEKIAE